MPEGRFNQREEDLFAYTYLKECAENCYRKNAYLIRELPAAGIIDALTIKYKLINNYHCNAIQIFTMYLSYNIADYRSAYAQIETKQLISNGGVEHKTPPNLPDKEDAMGYPLYTTLFSKPSARK